MVGNDGLREEENDVAKPPLTKTMLSEIERKGGGCNKHHEEKRLLYCRIP